MSSNKFNECAKGHKDCEISCAAFFEGTRQESKLELTVRDFNDEDIGHLYECHKLQYCMWARERMYRLYNTVDDLESETEKLKATLAKERAEKTALRSKLDELSKKPNQPAPMKPASIQPAGKSIKLIVNPRNHVNGFCDALIKHGKANYKCTATAEYEQRFCILHIDEHEASIEVPQPVQAPQPVQETKKDKKSKNKKETSEAKNA